MAFVGLFACDHGFSIICKTSIATSDMPTTHHLSLTDVFHYYDVIMGAIASQITNFTIVYSTVHSGADQRKHQSSTSPALVRGIHWWPVDSPHKWPVTRKMFPFDDVIMSHHSCCAMHVALAGLTPHQVLTKLLFLNITGEQNPMKSGILNIKYLRYITYQNENKL